jgi:hypothetical protein
MIRPPALSCLTQHRHLPAHTHPHHPRAHGLHHGPPSLFTHTRLTRLSPITFRSTINFNRETHGGWLPVHDKKGSPSSRPKETSSSATRRTSNPIEPVTADREAKGRMYRAFSLCDARPWAAESVICRCGSGFGLLGRCESGVGEADEAWSADCCRNCREGKKQSAAGDDGAAERTAKGFGCLHGCP